MKSNFTGQLYQFRTKNPLKNGDYVAVNGPWDSFGVVMSCKHEPAPTAVSFCTPQEAQDKPYLNVIRGVKPRIIDRPVAQF